MKIYIFFLNILSYPQLFAVQNSLTNQLYQKKKIGFWIFKKKSLKFKYISILEWLEKAGNIWKLLEWLVMDGNGWKWLEFLKIAEYG